MVPMQYYGESPSVITDLDLDGRWEDFVNYHCLTVRTPRADTNTLPPALEFLDEILVKCLKDAKLFRTDLSDPYVYVTAQRGFVTPGDTLDKPGWHCDDFGGEDLNYVWTDKWPTRFLLSGEPLSVAEDDEQALLDMKKLADRAKRQSKWGIELERRVPYGMRIVDGLTNRLMRLSPYVIHSVPKVAGVGEVRSFLKISVSNNRHI